MEQIDFFIKDEELKSSILTELLDIVPENWNKILVEASIKSSQSEHLSINASIQGLDLHKNSLLTTNDKLIALLVEYYHLYSQHREAWSKVTIEFEELEESQWQILAAFHY